MSKIFLSAKAAFNMHPHNVIPAAEGYARHASCYAHDMSWYAHKPGESVHIEVI